MNYKQLYVTQLVAALRELGLEVKGSTEQGYMLDVFKDGEKVAMVSQTSDIHGRYEDKALLEKIESVSHTTKKAVDAYWDAPALTMDGLPPGYRRIGEMAGVILAARLVNDRFEYAVCDRSMGGEVYTADFEKAREEFCRRAEIIDLNKQFTETEMKVITNGLVAFRDMGFVDSAEQERILDKLTRRIQAVVEHIEKEAQIAEEEGVEPEMQL